jgi:hypothetical protein
MGAVIRDTNNIPELTRVLRTLGRKEITVGIHGEDNYQYGSDADLVTIAHVHEFGADIRPVTAKYLTIPLVPEAKGKRARDFPNLHKQGRALCDENGRAIFALLDHVKIPERSFIRTGYDENVGKITDKIKDLLPSVLELDINPEIFLDAIGREFAGLIQRHTRTVMDPPNAPSTINVKGSSNPLHDTGRMIGAINHKIK